MTRSRIWLLTLAVVFAAGGCLTISPAGSPAATLVATTSPGASPTVTPDKTRRPRRTPTLPPATLPPTVPPTTAPTATPTTPVTLPPTAPPTATATTSTAEFDWSLTPVYGSVPLAAGFIPDPYTISALGGGPVDAAYLGGGCAGFATSEPTLEISYTAVDATLLRFYYVSELARDATLIVNDPGANWVCGDDSYTSVNPTVDFDSPVSGTYDVWVGAFVGGTDVSGTLYVTELDSNHP